MTAPRTRSLWALDSVRWKLLYLASDERRRVGRAIDQLAETPVPKRAGRVRGTRRLYCLAFGEHRILYVIEVERIVVLTLESGRREMPARLRREGPDAPDAPGGG
jgi:mRNA-degrading endonuclease RelE of RelBE toxin-antitoxin system